MTNFSRTLVCCAWGQPYIMESTCHPLLSERTGILGLLNFRALSVRYLPGNLAKIVYSYPYYIYRGNEPLNDEVNKTMSEESINLDLKLHQALEVFNETVAPLVRLQEENSDESAIEPVYSPESPPEQPVEPGQDPEVKAESQVEASKEALPPPPTEPLPTEASPVIDPKT